MNLDNKTYLKWYKLALVITKNNQYIAQEVLHTVLLELLLKHNIEEVSDNYVFMALKNRYLSYMKAEKKHEDFPLSLDKYDEDKYQEGNEDTQLTITKKVLHELDDEEKQLFTLHFTRGYSQRKISRELNLKLYYVIQKIKTIKNLINQEYEKSKETIHYQQQVYYCFQ